MHIQPRFTLPTRVPTLLSSMGAPSAETPAATTPAPRAVRTPAANWKAFTDGVVAALSKLLLKGRPLTPTKAPVTPEAPQAPSWIGDRLHARRADWFISQYKNAYNPQEDTKKNANCGPASVTMIAKAFGKINPSVAQADAAIEETRRRMGESLDEKEWTSASGLVKAAQSYGLDAYNRVCKTLGDFKSELAKGRLLVANVVPKYLDESNTGGHFTVVTAIKDGKVFLNDPISNKGPVVVSEQEFMRAVQVQNTYAVTSIGT